MCEFADQILSGNTLTIKCDGRGTLSIKGVKGTLPCFHPDGDVDTQCTVMRKAQLVILTRSVRRSERLQRLLDTLSPTCHVRILHNGFVNETLDLPEIASLTIRTLRRCACHCAVRPWKHGAKRVIIERCNTWSDNCPLIQWAFNSDVEHLELHDFERSEWRPNIGYLLWARGNYAPRVPNKHPFYDHDRHPNLVMNIRLLKSTDGRQKRALSQHLALLFDVKVSQVKVHDPHDER